MKPDRKIVASAAAAIIVWLLQVFIPELAVPPGIEGAFAVVVAYLVPGTRQAPLAEHPDGQQVAAEDLPRFNHFPDEE